MKTTVGKIMEAQGALQRLAALPLKIRLTFRIARVLQKVEAEFKIADEQRTALIKTLGEKVPAKPGLYKVKDKHIDEYQEELKSLFLTEVEIFGVEPLDIAEFDENMTMMPADAVALEDFIQIKAPSEIKPSALPERPNGLPKRSVR